MCVFLFLCLFKLFPVWAAEGRPDEGGGLHSKEVAPGFAAVLLRSQRAAVSQKNSHAWADARLHSRTGTETASDLSHLELRNFKSESADLPLSVIYVTFILDGF